MSKQMLTIKLKPQQAHLDEVRRHLNLSSDEIDADFGVVNIDPKKNLYAILVEERVAQRLGGKQGVEGPYANPPIEPFGPPEKCPKG